MDAARVGLAKPKLQLNLPSSTLNPILGWGSTMAFTSGWRVFLFAILSLFIASVGQAGAQNAPAKVRIFQENAVCPETNIPCRTNRNLALVFVHGLTGASGTWLNSSTSKSWPKMISQDTELADYDVFRVDFDSFALASSPSISEINDEFAIIIDKLASSGYRHVAFIAHSLGGLIVQRYLSDVIGLGGHTALNKFRIVFFLGTPQKGSSLANYVSFVSRNPQLRVLKSYNENDFTQFLQKNTQGISSKHDAQLCATLRFFAAYEGRTTDGLMIVERDSAVAISHACQEYPLNHVEISKPADESSNLYKDVKELLVACAAQHRNVCPPPRQEVGCANPNASGIRNDYPKCEFRAWSNVFRSR
ncbi:MAG: alpha/beta fold hydrolase [Bradyrhizobium sp.]|uniref:esterase/lipase family protein n=1 Tax=Bradyrhizobium sp. TaxID=376 RepID=UPI0025B7CBA4|nr:alpha/beta fold hydrolase [Bradyrhizobium sp.]MBI5261574.1 alpha/beta fold hydrolase [Bradyrhizobium sp.]